VKDRSLSKCESADDFKNLLGKPGEKEYPTDDDNMWELPQSCFVTQTVFEAFGTGCTMRAGDLAMELLWSHDNNGESEESEPEGNDKVKKETEKETKLLLFLWAVKNFRTTKVSLQEALPTTTALTIKPSSSNGDSRKGKRKGPRARI
jgi:hypothetical protein